MQTVSPPPAATEPAAKKTKKPTIIRQKSQKVSYAPVFLAALLVIGFFAALSFVVATDDVAQVVNLLGYAGWIVAGLGGLLFLGVLVRRFKPLLGLGWLSALAMLVAGVLLAQFAPAFTAPAHYSQGQTAVANGEYERAIVEYRLANNPDYLKKEIPAAYYRWGEKSLKAGDYERALAQFERVIAPEHSPNPEEVRVPDARARVYLAWAEKLDRETSRAWLSYNDAQKAAADSDLLAKYDAAIALNPAPALANQAKSGARNVLYRRSEDFKAQSNFTELDNTYQKIIANYMDGKPQSLSEVELRRAYNYLDWGRRLATTTNFNSPDESLRVVNMFRDAESRLRRYDAGRVNTVLPDLFNSYTKLGPALVNAGRFDEAISELNTGLGEYGAKDGKNQIARALYNSYVELGKDQTVRNSFMPAQTTFKTAFDLNDKFKFNDSRAREGLGTVFIKRGEEAEGKKEFKGAIDIYREGQKLRYFSPAEVTTTTNFISRSFFSWGQQQIEQNPEDLEKALEVFRDALKNNGFVATDRTRAVDTGGEFFLRRAQAFEQKNDLAQALNIYNTLSADAQFNASATARNLVNYMPRTAYTLAEQYIAEAKATDPYSTTRWVDARNLLQDINRKFAASEFSPKAKAILDAPVEVKGFVKNNRDEPLGSRPMQLATQWTVCTATTPDTDPDCKGKKDGFVSKGEIISFTTAPNGDWTVYLKPGQQYLLSWQERGSFVSTFIGTFPQQNVLLRYEPLAPIKYEYKTPGDVGPAF
jgi:tetratricopeptide (TPR) repeat protein